MQILIVEDDDSIRETLKMLLEVEGYSVRAVQNGKEALDLLHGFDMPCLILLDLMMPIMDGWSFLRERKKDFRLAPIPVVIVSAVANNAPMGEVNKEVKKPIDIDILLNVVGQYCRKASP